LDRATLFRPRIPSIPPKRRLIMTDIRDWLYFLLPEDNSHDAHPHPVSAVRRIGKTLLWTAMAVLIGLLLGHPF
jgi:hypothetical protein